MAPQLTLNFSLLLRSSAHWPNISEYAFCRFSLSVEIYLIGRYRPGKGVRGVNWHYWKRDCKSGWVLDGRANIASIFILGTNVFRNSLYRGDELAGLFDIATIEDAAFQCYLFSFELIELWTCFAVLEMTCPQTIRVVAFAASTSASACASATASAVCRSNRT